MVTTQSGTICRNELKAQRLLDRLVLIGLIDEKVKDVHYRFVYAAPRFLTHNSRWTLRCRPSAIVFERKQGDCFRMIMMGCVHDSRDRCMTCDVHPDADVKDVMNLARLRARNVNILWERDAYVNELKH